ncbi:MAG: TrkA family potassium uptake protein [Coriobacteriia bacterium]|nr:TrkA family potassium uptake protein [Coriobacteriia bacterium]
MYVIIMGGGKVGEYLASTLLKSGNEVAIIEKDLETADTLSEQFDGPCLVICGDGCDSRVQEDAGIRRADVFVAATGFDDANLVSCEIAQRVFNAPRAVARVNNPKNQRIFRAVGIESINSTTLIANYIEEEAMLGGISIVSSLAQSNVALAEVTVPRMRFNPEGIEVMDVPLPEGSLIVATADADGVEVIGEETVIHSGDRLIVIADSDVIDEVRSVIRGL